MGVLYSGLVNAPDLVTYHFRFQTNGTSDPDNLIPANAGITDITRTAGPPITYSVTFTEKHPTFVTMSSAVLTAGALGAGSPIVVTPVSYTASTGVLVVKVVDPDLAGVPAATDTADNDWVCCSVVFARRTATVVSGAI